VCCVLYGMQRLRQYDEAKRAMKQALELHKIFLSNESSHYKELKSAYDHVCLKSTPTPIAS
jgi:hypothetical protein